jgi:hypothetical protein
MNKEARKSLRQAVVSKLHDDMMPLEVGGHTITNQLVYAGCSQWACDGREWDTSKSGMARIVDGEFQLTFPNLDHFDGHNQIERQTNYYLQPDRAEDPPREPVGEPLRNVPDAILLEIAKGLADAITAHKARQEAEDHEAITLAATLST